MSTPSSIGTAGGVLKIVSTAVAPLTMITAILLFTGWVRTRAYFGYFGVDTSSLGLGPQDYILRSGDLGVGAVLVFALVVGVMLVVDRVVAQLMSRVERREIQRRVEVGLAVLGVALAIGGMAVVVDAVAVAVAPSVSAAAVVALGAVLILRFGHQAAGRRGHWVYPRPRSGC